MAYVRSVEFVDLLCPICGDFSRGAYHAGLYCDETGALLSPAIDTLPCRACREHAGEVAEYAQACGDCPHGCADRDDCATCAVCRCGEPATHAADGAPYCAECFAGAFLRARQ